MFSFETEYIIRKIQNRVLGSRDNVSLRLILSAPIHDAIKVYFRASVADKHGSPKRFHTEHSADVESMKSEIDLLLPSNYTFNKDTFTSLLTDAVHFQFNYLCRPRWTMKEFFFQNSAAATIPELKQGFLYFSAYNYYPKVLFRYLQKKNITSITRDDFDQLILKIDTLTLGDATPDDFGKLLQPFADFIAYGREDHDASIPEHALALFFGDKGFNHIRNYLEHTLQSRQIEKVTIDELRSYLAEMPEGGLPDKPVSPPPPSKTEEPVEAITPEPESVETIEDTVEPTIEDHAGEQDFKETDTDTFGEEISEEFDLEFSDEKESTDIDEPIAEPEEEFVDEIPGEEHPDETVKDEFEDDIIADTPDEDLIDQAVEDEPVDEDIIDQESHEETVTEEEPSMEETVSREEADEEPPVVEEPFEEEPESGEIPDEEFELSEYDKEQKTEPGAESESTSDESDYEEAEKQKEPEQYIEDELFQPIKREPEISDDLRDEPEDIEETQEEDLYDEPAGESIPDEDFVDEDESDHIVEEPYTDQPIEEESFEPRPKKPKSPSATMPPLDLLIEDDERKRFVRKLFNGDAAYFNIVVQTLNKMTSWKEASLYIDEIFLMNGVDPYSTDSVNFTDKVYTRFSHKSKYK